MQNDRVNKFDPVSVAAMLALDAAMANHPDPGDGPLHRFSVWAEPHVMIGDFTAALLPTRATTD